MAVTGAFAVRIKLNVMGWHHLMARIIRPFVMAGLGSATHDLPCRGQLNSWVTGPGTVLTERISLVQGTNFLCQCIHNGPLKTNRLFRQCRFLHLQRLPL